MAKVVQIGPAEIGDGAPCFIVAEIGINHNGSLEMAMKLIDCAVGAGCDAVKFQKRTVDVVYTPDELARPRESPFGSTNGDLKRALELGVEEYRELDAYCRDKGILWFVSCWDESSVDFTEQFDPPAYKVASASLTDDNLLRYTRNCGKPIILSTGMSSLEEVDHAVEVLGIDQLILLHTNSTYPAAVDELNLSVIATLRERYDVLVGYSGHEVGLATTVAAVALGARVIERHITLNRALWGSDQAASVEPGGFARLVKDIRSVEKALGDGKKRVLESEKPNRKKLRRVR